MDELQKRIDTLPLHGNAYAFGKKYHEVVEDFYQFQDQSTSKLLKELDEIGRIYYDVNHFKTLD
jgi:hypothetical protein